MAPEISLVRISDLGSYRSKRQIGAHSERCHFGALGPNLETSAFKGWQNDRRGKIQKRLHHRLRLGMSC